MTLALTIASTLFSCSLNFPQDTTKLSALPPAMVAVIASPNLSKDKWEDLKKQESQMARTRVEELFKERGFEIAPDTSVDACTENAHIDFHDEEQWTKKNIGAIGKKCGAKIVVFIAIKQTRSKTVGNFLLSRAAGEAQIESWLLEVGSSKAVLDGFASKGQKLAPPAGNTGLRLGAVRNAVEAAFKPVLKDIPVTKGAEK